MTVKIGSARINEKGTVSGGIPGDQTGNECSIQDWYLHAKGWRVLRAKDIATAGKIADNMQSICTNGHIGYCQAHRTSLYTASKPYDFDASKVTVDCECDCSEAVRVCCLYAGIIVPPFSTSGEVQILMSTGKFILLDSDVDTKCPERLRRGDILVTKTKGHTVVVVDDGSGQPASSTNPDGLGIRWSIGDAVCFIGNTHFRTSNDIKGYPTRPGRAKVTNISIGAAHPVHLVHLGAASNVYGWVDLKDIEVDE